jgi:hypothetical protein
MSAIYPPAWVFVVVISLAENGHGDNKDDAQFPAIQLELRAGIVV